MAAADATASITRRVGRAIDFAPVAVSLRREVLRLYYEDGKSLVDAAGLNTLATNSGLAESRTAILEHALQEAGLPSLAGLDVLDIGCGFGALSLVFAARGASVVAADPNSERFVIGRRVAEEHGLSVRWVRSTMENLDVGEAAFDVAVMNNSLCYVIPRKLRRQALERTLRALRPGGVLVIRNPNRIHHTDQFSGLPLVGMLPPAAAHLVARVMRRRNRSEVRLLTHRAARRELAQAGFTDVRSVRRTGQSRLRDAVSGYQHFIARRPPE
jgi:2-polyprenyl-3-methyl-5-hydroxy-6-metoxy-1,4-benzoquinol methylase